MLRGSAEEVVLTMDHRLLLKGRICVSSIDSLWEVILDEGHYWACFRCLIICRSRMKRPSGLPLKIDKVMWKLEHIFMGIMVGLPLISRMFDSMRSL